MRSACAHPYARDTATWGGVLPWLFLQMFYLLFIFDFLSLWSNFFEKSKCKCKQKKKKQSGELTHDSTQIGCVDHADASVCHVPLIFYLLLTWTLQSYYTWLREVLLAFFCFLLKQSFPEEDALFNIYLPYGRSQELIIPSLYQSRASATL